MIKGSQRRFNSAPKSAPFNNSGEVKAFLLLIRKEAWVPISSLRKRGDKEEGMHLIPVSLSRKEFSLTGLAQWGINCQAWLEVLLIRLFILFDYGSLTFKFGIFILKR